MKHRIFTAAEVGHTLAQDEYVIALRNALKDGDVDVAVAAENLIEMIDRYKAKIASQDEAQ